MIFISQMFFAMLLTCTTGATAQILWRLFRKIIEYRNQAAVYLMLRLICILYVLPIGYVAIQLTVDSGYIQTERIWKKNFETVNIMSILFTLMMVLWIFMIIKCAVGYIRQWMQWKEMHRHSIPVLDERMLTEFAKICRELHIHRKIRLYYSTTEVSPMVTGVFRYRIFVPRQDYTDEQLRVIFYHELMHCKSGDIYYKLCAVYIDAIHSVVGIRNNEIWHLLDEWGECHCDSRTIKALGGEITVKQYFEIIVTMMQEKPILWNGNYICSTLYENQSSLERRIEYMKEYKKISRTAKAVSFAAAFVFAMTSVTATYAAGVQMSKAQEKMYRQLETIDMEGSAAAEVAEPEEFTVLPEEMHGSVRMMEAETGLTEIMPMLDANEMVNFSWTVSPDTRFISSKFYVKKGQKIAMSASVTPGGQKYWLGIMNSRNEVRCVEGTSAMGHEFAITESGYYYAMVQNLSTTQKINANGSYYYY